MARGSLSRRAFLGASAAVATSALAACAPATKPAPVVTATPVATLPPPETTTFRLPATLAGCDPFFWLADDFLREEGFTDVQRAKPGARITVGDVDVAGVYANLLIGHIEAGNRLVAVAGGHVGCLELWARPGVSGLRDLRGKSIVVSERSTTTDAFYGWYVSFLTSAGIDPSEITWIEDKNYTSDYLVNGKVDAFVAPIFEPYFLRDRVTAGTRLILDTAMDKPWSDNYCCLITMNRDWTEKYPVAAKRATRAFLRATDAAAKDPKLAAKLAIEKKLFPARVTEAIIADFLGRMPMRWREYDPEDTLRFFTLRLADGKLIKKTPQQIISEGSDFAYFRQLTKELKA